MKSRGFTLIELLVVITLIGILAVAVLSALNPIEQINKARDARRKADAAQLIQAIDRYYATNEYFPWSSNTFETPVDINAEFMTDAAAAGVGVCGGTTVTQNDTGDGGSGCADDGLLIASQELKQQFSGRAYFKANKILADTLYMIKSADDPSVNVCFVPSSSATRDKPETLKTVDLTTGIDDCSTETPPSGDEWSALATACFVCLPEE